MTADDLRAYLLENAVPVAASGCWIWANYVDVDGFGRVPRWTGHALAHRASFAVFRGDPGKHDVVHVCGQRACVRPEHLALQTRSETVKRGWSTSRVKRTATCKNGHDIGSAASVYVTRTGTRKCRECRRIWGRRSRERKRPKVRRQDGVSRAAVQPYSVSSDPGGTAPTSGRRRAPVARPRAGWRGSPLWR